MLVSNELGNEILNALRFETALGKRGEDDSSLFSAGSVDEWLAVRSERWDQLAYEYRSAAEALAAAHSSADPFPTLALLAICRHHLELALKAVIASAEGAPLKKGDHSLKALWTRAEPRLRESKSSIGWDEAAGSACATTILEFDALDPDATRFRYPSAKGTSTPFDRPGRLFAFGLATFMKEFLAASDFLWDGLLWLEVLHVAPRQVE